MPCSAEAWAAKTAAQQSTAERELEEARVLAATGDLGKAFQHFGEAICTEGVEEDKEIMAMVAQVKQLEADER